MERQVKAVAVLGIINGMVELLCALGFAAFGVIFLWIGSEASKTHGPNPALSVGCGLWFGFALVCGGLAWLDLAIGQGLMRFRSWTRTAAIVRSVLHLPALPIGTLIGAWTLVVLTDPGARVLFQGAPVAGLRRPARAA